MIDPNLGMEVWRRAFLAYQQGDDHYTGNQAAAAVIQDAIAKAVGERDALPMVGEKVIWGAHGIELEATVTGYTEGWINIKLSDGSFAISRPSHILTRTGEQK